MNSSNKPLPSKAKFVRAADAPVVALTPTDHYRFLSSSTRDGGELEVYDGQSKRGDGPPLHRHPWATWEIVLEGQVRFVIDDEQVVLGPGDFVYTPPNAAHTYVIESDTARVIGINGPGAMLEALQRKAAPVFRTGGPPDMAKIVGIAKEHQVEVLGPPLAATQAKRTE